MLFQDGDDLLFSMPLALHRAIAIESKRTIEIDEFVPKKEIDELYLNTPYYLVPDGDVGQQAFAVIRDAIRKVGMVALGRVVFTSREHVIPLEPRGKGLLGVTLRYPYEVRTEEEYFDDIPDEKIPKDMLELASHIVETKSGHFEPEQFEDQYEDALKELLKNRGLFQPGNPRLDYLLAAQVHERHAGIALQVRGNAADLAGAGDHLAFLVPAQIKAGFLKFRVVHVLDPLPAGARPMLIDQELIVILDQELGGIARVLLGIPQSATRKDEIAREDRGPALAHETLADD